MKARGNTTKRALGRRRAEEMRAREADWLPDVRDGLNRVERAILATLAELLRERGRESVSTAMLYGRLAERVDVSQQEFMQVLQKLVGSSPRGGRPG